MLLPVVACVPTYLVPTNIMYEYPSKYGWLVLLPSSWSSRPIRLDQIVPLCRTGGCYECVRTSSSTMSITVLYHHQYYYGMYVVLLYILVLSSDIN